MNNFRGKKQGAVLLSALGALVLSFVLLGAFLTLNALRAGIIRQEGRGLQAYHAARAGIEAGLYFLAGGEPENGGPPGGIITLSGDGERRSPANERVFIYFHERGEGFFSGRIFDGARCEVTWKRDENRDSGDAYRIKSTGIAVRRGSDSEKRTVYAYVEERGGNFYITGWYE